MLKRLMLVFSVALILAIMPGISQAMLGDDEEAKEKLGSQFPPPVEPEEAGELEILGGVWMNGCWESRDPIEQYNPIFIPTASPQTPYELLPGVLDPEMGDKLAMLCNCRAMFRCDTLMVIKTENRPQNQRQRVITKVLDVTPEMPPFKLIP